MIGLAQSGAALSGFLSLWLLRPILTPATDNASAMPGAFTRHTSIAVAGPSASPDFSAI